jgi:8-oxo-dGTP pyrophosphatase MutT (NUDIX family)
MNRQASATKRLSFNEDGFIDGMGAGILPVAVEGRKVYFLFGREAEDGRWSDFGGGREGDETMFETAVREGCEELEGMLGCGAQLAKRLRNDGLGTVRTQTYTTFLLRIPFDKHLPGYFAGHRSFIEEKVAGEICGPGEGLFEKSEVRWVPAWGIEMRKMRFRPWYSKVVGDLYGQRRQIEERLGLARPKRGSRRR